MNILFLSTWFPYPPDNGSRIRARYLLRALTTRHEVAVAAFDRGVSGDRFQLERNGANYSLIESVADDPFRNTDLPTLIKYLSPTPVTLWPNRLMQQAVDRLAYAQSWDAVVAFQSPVARYAKRVPASAYVFDLDAALSHTMHSRFVAQVGLVSRFHAWLSWQKAERHEASLARDFHICTIASSHELDHLKGLIGNAPAKAVVLPNGVDCEHNQPDQAPKVQGRLVFNGALTYEANFDAMRFFLGKIYPIIKKAFPKISLAITGSTKGVDLVGLALDNSVRLTGYVDDVRIPVSEAEVCVVPLRQGGGTRLKILEAMALGTPVVTTVKGAEGLDVVSGEHLLVADDPAAFARHTIELLTNPILHAKLATNARRLVEERYDWREIGHRFTALVEEAVERSRNKHQ